MQKSKLKVIAGIVLVFCLGLLVGSLGTGIYIKHRVESFAVGGPMKHRIMAVRRLSDRLDLTKEQQTEIEKIVDRTLMELHELRKKHHPVIEEIRERSFMSIKEKLRDDQKEKMDKLYEELKKRWRKRRMRNGRHHGPPH